MDANTQMLLHEPQKVAEVQTTDSRILDPQIKKAKMPDTSKC